MALARKLTSKIYEIQAHAQKVTCLDLGGTGRVLVTGGQDRNVNLWAFGNDTCFMSLAGHNGQIDCVKFAYNDDYVYSADENGIIKRWDLNGQPGCTSTFYGHMKSVRTLDFHPYGEYVASGSNDTTVRLWDVRKNNTCIENYRGHIANVNSVKFSPDGSWIASSGTEGCLIIWDIRMRKKIIEFQEHASPITCIQFHPFEFLIAAGRNDGTVDLYDLESKKLISRTDSKSAFNGHTVKCISFSENGECLFVGTAEGISVIGWEPDREFDHIESAWSILGDMKVINKKLFCGSFENQVVKIHDIHIDQVIPFFNPSNTPFNHNQSSRRSFTRGNQKLRLSIGKSKKRDSFNASMDSPTHASTDGGLSSPNSLSFEMIEESEEHQPAALSPALSSGFSFETIVKRRESTIYDTIQPTADTYMDTLPISLPNELDAEHYIDNYTSDLDFYPMRSSPGAKNVVEPEREDFPVNNAQPPDYAPKAAIAHHLAKASAKQKNGHHQQQQQQHMQRRHSPPNMSTGNRTFSQQQRKLSNVTSVSTMDLHRLDDSMSTTLTGTANKRHTAAVAATSSTSRSRSPVRNYISSYASNNNNNNSNLLGSVHSNNNNIRLKRSENTGNSTTTTQLNRDNNIKNKKLTVQIYTPAIKPPTRSKTSLDFRSSTTSSLPSSPSMHRTGTHYGSSQATEESMEINMLLAQHENVYQQLSNRYACLQIIRNSTRSHDVVGALRHALKMNDSSIVVDLLGAILEKKVSWNLDMCLLLLPEIYDLLQSDNKFHCTRACDTLRLILSNFLPIIQVNSDPWGPNRSLGVDITAEERRHKCGQCRNWLLRIKAIPDNEKHSMGTGIQQLQNLIVDL